MTYQISQGIKINVETFFQKEQSNMMTNEYFFAYRITIENYNSFTVRLVSRHWHIFDSNATMQDVEGEGAVGVQPYIAPSQTYQYVSGCQLGSEMGKMSGEYMMENQETKELFKVPIPAFDLIAPAKLN